MTYIEENNSHVVMGWSPSNFMLNKIRPTHSVETEGLVRTAFTLLQEKKEKNVCTLMITTGCAFSLVSSR